MADQVAAPLPPFAALARTQPCAACVPARRSAAQRAPATREGHASGPCLSGTRRACTRLAPALDCTPSQAAAF